jgi:predicted GNAT family acetyltransferase
MDYPDDLQVHNSPERGRFEIQAEGHTAELTYTLEGKTITLVHTSVPPALEGRGIGSRLVKAGLDYARENGLKVIPVCSFVKAYIERHPAYQDLVV